MRPPRRFAGYEMPPTPPDVNIRNPSIKRLHFAIGTLKALHPNSAPVDLLWRRWLDFLHSDLYRITPDVQLYPFYKAFSQGYHVAWRLVPNPRPTQTPDISLVTLVAEDVLENMDDFERALDKTFRIVGKGVREVTSSLLLPVFLILGIFVLAKRA